MKGIHGDPKSDTHFKVTFWSHFAVSWEHVAPYQALPRSGEAPMRGTHGDPKTGAHFKVTLPLGGGLGAVRHR